MSWHNSPPNDEYSTPGNQLTLKQHYDNAIRAIDAEIDSVMNNKKKNTQYKAAAVRHWTEKKEQLLRQLRADEDAIQCKHESPIKDKHKPKQ